MTAEAIPRQPEADLPPHPDLRVVRNYEPNDDATDQVAAYVHAVDNELIPASVEDADAAVAMIRHYDERVKKALDTGANTVETDVADSLHEIAESGTNIWKLSDTEHADYSALATAKKEADLPVSARAYLGQDGKTFSDLKKEAKARLTLDRALNERVVAEAAGKLSKSMEAAGFAVGKTSPRAKQSPKRKVSSAVEIQGTGIAVDAKGRGHRDHGKFISKKQLEQIESHADLIRGDQQGTREAYEAREVKRQAELNARIAAKAKKAAFKQGFGSRALERVAGLREQIENEAADVLAQQGHDMAYRQKSPTPTDELPMPEGFGFSPNTWDMLSADEKRKAIATWNTAGSGENSRAQDLTMPEGFGFSASTWNALSTSEKRKAITTWNTLANDENASTVQNLPMPEGFGFSPDTWDMLSADEKRKAIATWDALAKDEKRDSHDRLKAKNRRRLAAIVIGAGALAGAILSVAQHSTEEASASASPQPVVAGKVLHPKFDDITIHSGDNIWDIEEARHPRMDEPHIRKLVQRDLHANHMSWGDAHHLQPGEHIKISHKK